MIIMANILIILLPLLLLTALAWFTLLTGFRRSDQPACRGCRASLVRSGPVFTQCPECDLPIGPKDVVFLGRTRPWPIWAITFLLTAPSAVFLVTGIILFSGVIDGNQLIRTLNGTETGDSISVYEAQQLETDQLIAEMIARPEDQMIWEHLWERFDDAPPMTEQQALDILIAADEELQDSTMPVDLHTNWMISKVLDRLGYGHPRILELFESHLLEPAGCPTVNYKKNSLLTIDYASSPATGQYDVLTSMRDHARAFTVPTAIRIDGYDIKPRNEQGRSVWRPGWAGGQQKTIYARYLPPDVLEPGEHTLEIDLTNVVLPNGTPYNLAPEEWPAVVVRKNATLTCTFTIDGPNPSKP